MPIQAYFHCKNCMEQGLQDRIDVGLSDPQTITVRCQKCDSDVGHFKLAEPMPWGICGTCGKPLGPGHVH